MVSVSVVVLAGLVALLVLADDLPAILALAFVAVHFPTVTRLFNILHLNPLFQKEMITYCYSRAIYLMSETLLIFAGFGTVLGKAFHL